MTPIKQEIFLRLTQKFCPVVLNIQDDSIHHQGHAESGSGQETHFSILIVAPFFEGLSRIKRTRAVNDVLKDLIKTSIHAISLTLQTQQEYEIMIKN